MAVLKDLIVHGPSRFINAAYFKSLKTDKIGAEEGIFNKIVATTGDIGSLTVDDLTAGKATVLSLLDVRGELHTNQWTNSNIATIDGSFYITPTIGISEGTMTTTGNSLSVYGSNFPISSLYVNGINSDNTASTVAWTSGSKVLVTGEILVNGTYMPLGTLVGTLGSNVTASRIDIDSITDNRYQAAASLAEIGTQSTALPCRNVKVSLYQTSRSSTLYPLGIFMTALGENGKTFLDIYGGGYAASATAGGFARPVLRIGNLKDLPTVGGSTPTGYGIYTSNGYFSGTIVAKQGKIGDGTAAWTIGNDSNNRAYIYSGITNITTSGSTTGIYVGTNGISNYSSATQYVNLTGGKITAQGADIQGKITASSGSIGGWTIDTSKLYSGTHSTWNSAAEDGLYLGTDGIAGGSGGIWYLWKDGSAKIGAMTLGADGTLTVPAANVNGALTAATISASKLTSGTIDTSILTANNIVTDTITMGTAGSNSYIYVSKNNKSSSINNETKNWRLILGNYFAVSEAGYLTASSGKIGGWNISSTALCSATTYTPASGRILLAPAGVTTSSAVGNLPAATYAITAGSDFGVTTAGKLYATGAEISGKIKATEFNGINSNNETVIAMNGGNYPGFEIYYDGEQADFNTRYLTMFGTSHSQLGDNIGRIDIMAPIDDGDSLLLATHIDYNNTEKRLIDLRYDDLNLTTNLEISGYIMSPSMAGQIIMTGCPAGGPGSSTLVPDNNTTVYEPIHGWLICNGAAVSRTKYAALFAVIGTTYGSGNGSTTFNLPDFRGRVGVGAGTGTATDATAHTLNQKAGEETHVLKPSETAMKAHSHGTSTSGKQFVTITSGTSMAVNRPGSSGTTTNYFLNVGTSSNPFGRDTNTESTTAANGSAHNIMQPYIGINYIICTGETDLAYI